jgi:hypothetical protein
MNVKTKIGKLELSLSPREAVLIADALAVINPDQERDKWLARGMEEVIRLGLRNIL